MKRILSLLAAAMLLSGCLPSFTPFKAETFVPATGTLDFNWLLSGAQAVAPQQIFSDQQHIWLHFADNQPIPAIFGVRDGQTYTLTYRQFAPYIIIEGLWPQLLFHGGHLSAQAKHQPAATMIGDSSKKASLQMLPTSTSKAQESSSKVQESSSKAQESALTTASSKRVPQAEAQAVVINTQLSAPGRQTADGEPRSSVLMTQPTAPAAHKNQANSAGSTQSTQAAGSPRQQTTTRFRLSPDDHTLRQAFQRWATQEGWSFAAEHWELEVDYPILNRAEFEGEFMNAVEQVLKSVRLVAKPLRACFHSNRVLRIIPETHSCHPVYVEES